VVDLIVDSEHHFDKYIIKKSNYMFRCHRQWKISTL